MTTLHTDPLVADYLRRLEAAAAGLPRQRRTELVAQIREHVDEALRATGSPGEADVRNVLERLGPPQEIVDAAGEPADPPVERSRVGALEIVALVALLVPFAGWLLGSVLVLVSRAWTSRERVIGLSLPLLAFLLTALLPLAVPATTNLGPLETALVVGLGLVGGPLASLYLAWRLRTATRS